MACHVQTWLIIVPSASHPWRESGVLECVVTNMANSFAYDTVSFVFDGSDTIQNKASA